MAIVHSVVRNNIELNNDKFKIHLLFSLSEKLKTERKKKSGKNNLSFGKIFYLT